MATEAQGETTSCSRWSGRAWRSLCPCRARSGQPLGRPSLEEPLDLLQPLERPCLERITAPSSRWGGRSQFRTHGLRSRVEEAG